MSKIMVIGGSVLQLPAIKKAKEMGHYVVTVDFDDNCIGFKYTDEKLSVSTLDYEKIKDYIQLNLIDGIMTLASDRPVNTVAKIAQDFGLNAVSVEAAYNSTNKANMRKLLSNYEILMPSFSVVRNFNDFIQSFKSFNSPVIIKSSDNSGKRGVRKLEKNATQEEKEDAFKYALENSNSKEVLIEELIIGKEYSVESITWNYETSIIAVTEKYNSGEPSYVEIGHSQPADLAYYHYLDIEILVKKVIRILGINNTACHTEVMINENGTYLIEIGPRLGGDNISTALVMLSSGIDMVEASIQMCLGKKPVLNRIHNRGSAIKYLLPCKGIYNGYEMAEDICKIEGYHDFIITKENGYKMKSLSNSNDRIGYVIFSGTDKKTAELNATRAIKSIKLVLNK